MNELEPRRETVDRVRESVRRALELVGPGEGARESVVDDDLPPAA